MTEPEDQMMSTPTDATPALRQEGGDLVSAAAPAGWLVGGYFTPDYRHWADDLVRSLEARGAPYHLFAWSKRPHGRDANTLQKPMAILRAMDRYPDQILVWLDVDCEVAGDLAPLTATRADLAARPMLRRHPAWRRNRRHWLSLWRTGTLVIRPTPPARAFVERWATRCAEAQDHDNDQDGFLLALADAPGVTIAPLAPQWCARAGEGVAGTVIRHAGGPRGSEAAGDKRARERRYGVKRGGLWRRLLSRG
jgi:hypothetical protein